MGHKEDPSHLGPLRACGRSAKSWVPGPAAGQTSADPSHVSGVRGHCRCPPLLLFLTTLLRKRIEVNDWETVDFANSLAKILVI